MRKLLFITFICSSLCAYAQSEIPEDTIKNQPPVKKEQIPFSPKENKRTGLDESQPQQSLQGEQQEEINLHLPPSDYVEPLPWTDMKKIHFQKNIFEWDFQRFADFLLSPEVVLTMYDTDKRIHIVRRMLLRSHRCREHSKGDDTESNQSFHNIVRICSLLVSEHATHAGVIACTLQSYCKRSAVTLQTTLQ